MKEPIWIAHQWVLIIHDRLLAEYGGLEGLRDAALLESALARPRQLFAYGDPDLATLATAYIAGILRNHPFVDGNKRTGFITGYVFLARNDLQLIAPEDETTQTVLALAAGTVAEEAFSKWLRNHTTPR